MWVRKKGLLIQNASKEQFTKEISLDLACAIRVTGQTVNSIRWLAPASAIHHLCPYRIDYTQELQGCRPFGLIKYTETLLQQPT